MNQMNPINPEIKTLEYYLDKYPYAEIPDVEVLEEWASEGGCETPSGSWVETDGYDECNEPSWMLILGFI